MNVLKSFYDKIDSLNNEVKVSEIKDLISVIIPVYGDRLLVKMLYDRLNEETSKINADFEYIMVCDCCPYGSGSEIEKIALKDKRVKYIDLMKNSGQHLAIKAGIDYAQGDYAVVMDCDLQDNPKEIKRFYEKIKECGADVVFGIRTKRKESFLKKFYSKAANGLYSLFEKNNNENDKQCGNFSIFNKSVIEQLKLINEAYFAFSAVINALGYSKDYIDIEQEARPVGKSAYNFFKGLKLFIQLVVNNSNKPLLFAAYCSFIMFVFCFIFILKLFFDYFFLGSRLLGWTSLMSAIFFIGGLIFAYLGLLGIYIGQIFKLSQKRPLYTVRKKIN